MVTMSIKGGERIASILRSLPDRIDGGVKVTGPAAGYALVWEWGSARITKPGPKTTWGINPDGNRVILTLTAPTGYIRVNRQRYLDAIKDQIQAIKIATIPVSQWAYRLKRAFNNASSICAVIIQQSAPEDTGELIGSIQAVSTDEAILQTANQTSFDLGEAAFL